MFGWLVMPDSGAIAQSTIETPSSAALMYEAIWPPAQSWVWKWIGMPTSCLSAWTSTLRRIGLTQTRHVLDGQQVGAELLQPLRQS